MKDIVLDIDNLVVGLGKKPGGERIIDGISLQVREGETLCVVGESGSGKSVTSLTVMGLLQKGALVPMSGSVKLVGEELLAASDRRLRQLRATRMAMIFQEPMTALNPVVPVGRQIDEVLRVHTDLDARARRQKILAMMEHVRLPDVERIFSSYPHRLSGGQRQRIMIAMALVLEPKLLIADEPTTALDVTIRAQILALLAELQQEFGMAVLLITHDLNMVLRFAERVGVMSRGAIVETAPTAELFATPRHEYTRMLLNSRPAREVSDLPSDSPELVAAERLTCTFHIKRGWLRRDVFHAVRDVDLDVRRGETVGIVGESGSGKTTLGLALLRLQPSTGTIRLNGKQVDALPQHAFRPLRKNLQVVFQDPYSSLSPRRTIEQIVAEGLALHFADLTDAQRRSQVIDMLRQVGLDASILGRYPHEFSGGQRQRIAIARVAVLRPELLVLDEPTSALDATVQQQVLRLLVELQRRLGMSYLFISHDLAVIQAIAHRVIVMKDGVVVEHGETADILHRPTHPYTRRLIEASL
jgi:ABC-type microcin C transport system duplicated ATPase subunit YejF